MLAINCPIKAFWDLGTTTVFWYDMPSNIRRSFFQWEEITVTSTFAYFFGWVSPDPSPYSRRLRSAVGISIDFHCIGTGTLLNARTILTGANLLERWIVRERDVRIWCLGRGGYHYTPYRYRVWRIRRVYPRSNNPEHAMGPYGSQVSRHDVMVIQTMDRIYEYNYKSMKNHYAYRAWLTTKQQTLAEDIWYGGAGFMTLEHISRNWEIRLAKLTRDDVVDCSIYLPKWWGKFICVRNTASYAAVPNGGGFLSTDGDDYLFGIGAFEIRYNEDRICVFTDLRYYVDQIHKLANVTYGEYYEYAYPEYSQKLGWFYDGSENYPYVPWWQVATNHYPLGKK